jgi:hypothetical protein
MLKGCIVFFEYFLNMPDFVKAVVFATVILTLFSLILFLIKLRPSKAKRGSSKASSKRPVAPVNKQYAIKEISDDGNPSAITRYPGGLLAAASLISPSGNDVIYEQNGVPYINAALAKRNNQGILDNNFVKLVESVTRVCN